MEYGAGNYLAIESIVTERQVMSHFRAKVKKYTIPSWGPLESSSRIKRSLLTLRGREMAGLDPIKGEKYAHRNGHIVTYEGSIDKEWAKVTCSCGWWRETHRIDIERLHRMAFDHSVIVI